MANSKLLKEAIADAKAVRETAIANAKIALEEAFTPRLQSILSRKLQAEMEGEEEEVVEDIDSSEIGTGDNNEPAAVADDASTDLGVSDTEEENAEVGEEADETEVVDDLTEEEDVTGAPEEDVTNATYDVNEEEEGEEDELDLEAIIRELEGELDAEEEAPVAEEWDEEEVSEEDEIEVPAEEPVAEPEMAEEGEDDMEVSEEEEIDLDEILREMGYGDDEEEVTEEEDNAATAELEAELEEAYGVIKSLKKTINEVNLLNAKLLYANKLFRSYNLNNEQKVKVVENLDRTTSVREVKLVYATLAESMNFTGTDKKVSAKKTMTEGLASKPVASTAPKKEIISENTNELANRFKELAGIVRK